MQIAETLRGEFGAEIDARPGSATVEAGQVNRAFRMAASRIVEATVPRGADIAGVLTWVLRRAAKRRLMTAGVSDSMTVTLLDLEPGLGNSWHSYLVPAAETVVRALVEEVGSG